MHCGLPATGALGHSDRILTSLHLMMPHCARVELCLWDKGSLAGCIGCRKLLTSHVILLAEVDGSCRRVVIVILMLTACELHCVAAVRSCQLACSSHRGVACLHVAPCGSLYGQHE